jgi:choline dehydrogenase-like flavoprotein
MNQSQLNNGTGQPQALFGQALTAKLNSVLTRQFRLGCLVEQSPDDSNCVKLSAITDNLGLPRPEIHYNLSPYTIAGLVSAVETSSAIYAKLGAQEFTQDADPSDPSSIVATVNGKQRRIKYFGSGHIVGTYRMGTTSANSVVSSEQRSWDHPNLFLVGSGVFPTVATGNPTLTLAALALWAANTILTKDLK